MLVLLPVAGVRLVVGELRIGANEGKSVRGLGQEKYERSHPFSRSSSDLFSSRSRFVLLSLAATNRKPGSGYANPICYITIARLKKS